MDFRHFLYVIKAVGEAILGIAAIALIIYGKWRQIQNGRFSRDLGDGGIQRLLDSDRK